MTHRYKQFSGSPPPLVMRQFVKAAAFMPDRLNFTFVGASEMAGCIMFDELRRVARQLFVEEPEVAEWIELLYSEILTDEIGHVGYCASRCSSAERAMMRRIYPYIGRLFAPPDRGNQPSHRPEGVERSARPAFRRRRSHRGPEQRDISRHPPVTGRPQASPLPIRLRPSLFSQSYHPQERRRDGQYG